MDKNRLGDYVNIRTGKLDANASNDNGLYPFFTCSVEPLKINKYAYDCECVLVAGNGDLNVKYYNGKFNAYQRTYIIETQDKEKLDVKYLYWFMSLYINYLRNQSIGGVIKYIKLGNLTEAKLPLPPFEIQKKIADTLDKATQLIDKRKEQIEKMDEFLKSLFLDMFGDPVSNPKEWVVNEMEKISTKILSGNTPKGGKQVYVKEGITFFRSQNVWRNNLVFDDIAYIDKKTHNKMENSSLKNGDILMTKTGRINTENSSLGRAAIFLGEDDSANINGHVYLIRLKKNIINKFVLFILTTEEYREYIRSVCVGGIDKRQINKVHLEKFPIINPPIEMQKKFVNILEKTELEKEKLQKSLTQLENNFNSIMQKAFKGELF